MKIKKQFIYIIVLAFFPILVLFNNIKALLYNCFNAYDMGIYTQGIFEIASGNSFNPYITFRHAKTFNDHFNPVLILASPFAWISDYHPVSLIIFEWLCYISIFYIIFKIKKSWTMPEYLLSAAMIIFCKGILSGMQFPIHPDTWAIPVWAMLIYSIHKRSLTALIISSIAICLFKESYSFAIFGLSGYYLFRKDFKTFGWLLLISISITIFNFSIRPILMGAAWGHGTPMITSLLNSPFIYIWQSLMTFDYIVPFKLFYPFVIPLVWIIKNEVKNFKHPIFPLFFMMAPLLFLHFLANKFYFQYSVAFVVPLLTMIILSTFTKAMLSNRKLATLTIILFVASSSSIYTKMIKLTFTNKTSKCIISEAKKISTKKLLTYTQEIPSEKIIFSTEGVIPRILKPGMKIYARNGFGAFLEHYDYLLLERNHSGDIYPLSVQQVEAIEKACTPFATEIIHADDFYFLAKGDFPKKCILR